MKKRDFARLVHLLSICAVVFTSCSKERNLSTLEYVKSTITDPATVTSLRASATLTLDSLMSKSSGSTSSTSTPLGVHFENLHEATSAELDSLNDPSVEPAIPASQVGQWQLAPFSVTLYPSSDPSPADCNQTGYGDCSAISVFAEIAYQNAAFIKSIITDNNNNTYTVKMYNPSGNLISISVSNKFLSSVSDGSLVAVKSKTGGADWATIMEKALMKYNDLYQMKSGDIGGIGSEYASPVFTGAGSSFAFYSSVLSVTEIQKAVNAALSLGKIVIGGFKTSDVLVGQTKTVSSHAWAFSYAPSYLTNGYQSIFVMRNPWGNDNGTDMDGQLYVPSDSSVTDLIDLRIIDAGAAIPSVINDPYVPPTLSLTTDGVIFYQNSNYSGIASSSIPAGNYTLSQLESYGFQNDWASSIAVPAGWTVTLYDDDNFLGTSWTLTSNYGNLTNLSPSANDAVSSVKIQQDGQ